MGPDRGRTRDPWICSQTDTLPTVLRGPVLLVVVVEVAAVA